MGTWRSTRCRPTRATPPTPPPNAAGAFFPPPPPLHAGGGGSPPPALLGKGDGGLGSAVNLPPEYQPVTATPTTALDKLLVFRACHPLYGAYLVDLMGIADRDERIQLLESTLELPRPLLKHVRVPFDLSPG